MSVSDVSTDCDPIVKNKDIGKTTSINGNKLNPDDVAWPCGLVAKSFFNDNYTLADAKGGAVEINQKGIAWESDKEYKFSNWKGNNSAVTY